MTTGSPTATMNEMTSARTPFTQGSNEGAIRLRFHAAWGLGAVVFVSVGWMAVQPLDPEGAVSLLTHAQPSMMMLQVLALAAMTAAIATAVAGRFYPDIGVLAVGVGLSLVSLKGGNMTNLLISTAGNARLSLWLLAESGFWFATMLIAMLVSAIAARWCGVDWYASQIAHETAGGDAEHSPTMAVTVAPRSVQKLLGQEPSQTSSRNGFKYVLLTAGIALILIRILAAGFGDRAIHHGQACFAVAVGMYVAVGRAQSHFPVRSTFWACGAVFLACVMAYAYSWFKTTVFGTGSPLASVPSTTYLRQLPITYIAVGTSAAIVSHWRAVITHQQSTNTGQS